MSRGSRGARVHRGAGPQSRVSPSRAQRWRFAGGGGGGGGGGPPQASSSRLIWSRPTAQRLRWRSASARRTPSCASASCRSAALAPGGSVSATRLPPISISRLTSVQSEAAEEAQEASEAAAAGPAMFQKRSELSEVQDAASCAPSSRMGCCRVARAASCARAKAGGGESSGGRAMASWAGAGRAAAAGAAGAHLAALERGAGAAQQRRAGGSGRRRRQQLVRLPGRKQQPVQLAQQCLVRALDPAPYALRPDAGHPQQLQDRGVRGLGCGAGALEGGERLLEARGRGDGLAHVVVWVVLQVVQVAVAVPRVVVQVVAVGMVRLGVGSQRSLQQRHVCRVEHVLGLLLGGWLRLQLLRLLPCCCQHSCKGCSHREPHRVCCRLLLLGLGLVCWGHCCSCHCWQLHSLLLGLGRRKGASCQRPGLGQGSCWRLHRQGLRISPLLRHCAAGQHRRDDGRNGGTHGRLLVLLLVGLLWLHRRSWVLPGRGLGRCAAGQRGLEDGGNGGAHHILLLCLAVLLLWIGCWRCRRRCLLSRHLGGLDRPQRHLPLGL